MGYWLIFGWSSPCSKCGSGGLRRAGSPWRGRGWGNPGRRTSCWLERDAAACWGSFARLAPTRCCSSALLSIITLVLFLRNLLHRIVLHLLLVVHFPHSPEPSETDLLIKLVVFQSILFLEGVWGADVELNRTAAFGDEGRIADGGGGVHLVFLEGGSFDFGVFAVVVAVAFLVLGVSGCDEEVEAVHGELAASGWLQYVPNCVTIISIEYFFIHFLYNLENKKSD